MGALADQVRGALAERADPENAAAMAAYLKTDQPFFGVKRPDRVPIEQAAAKAFAPSTAAAYREQVLELWRQPERECQYTALTLARRWKRFVTAQQLDLYEQLVRDAAWWDLVDEIGRHLAGEAWLKDREATLPVLERWARDEDLWVWRAAVLAPMRDRAHYPDDRVQAWLDLRLDDTDFFARKAIGWVLRDRSQRAQAPVVAYLRSRWDRLSGLSRREGTRWLDQHGHWP